MTPEKNYSTLSDSDLEQILNDIENSNEQRNHMREQGEKHDLSRLSRQKDSHIKRHSAQPLPTRSSTTYRRGANNVSHSSTSTPKQGSPRRRISYWRVGIALYILFFLFFTVFSMIRLRLYLGEYEKSRPQHTIEDYVAKLDDGFFDTMVQQNLSTLSLSEYEGMDQLKQVFLQNSNQQRKYTWGKKADTYTDEHPVYFIRCDDAAIATVALECVDHTSRFQFPVWQAEPPVSLVSVSSSPQYDLDLTIPMDATVTINGIPVQKDKLTISECAPLLDKATAAYVEQPTALHLAITGLYAAPIVTATDATGKALTAQIQPATGDKHLVYQFVPEDDPAPDSALTKRVETLTKAYIDYMVNKNLQTQQNLNALDAFLIPYSDAYQQLQSMFYNVSWNNPYTARYDKVLTVSHVKWYGEKIFTCEAHFELQLTQTVVNDYNGTVRWVMVQVGNKWCAANFELLQEES